MGVETGIRLSSNGNSDGYIGFSCMFPLGWTIRFHLPHFFKKILKKLFDFVYFSSPVLFLAVWDNSFLHCVYIGTVLSNLSVSLVHPPYSCLLPQPVPPHPPSRLSPPPSAVLRLRLQTSSFPSSVAWQRTPGIDFRFRGMLTLLHFWTQLRPVRGSRERRRDDHLHT